MIFRLKKWFVVWKLDWQDQYKIKSHSAKFENFETAQAYRNENAWKKNFMQSIKNYLLRKKKINNVNISPKLIFNIH